MYAEVLLLYDKVTVRMREAQLKYRARADLLTEGGCRGILPLNILRRGSDITGYYSVSGYTRVSKLKDLSAEKALTVAEETLNAIEECCRCFIFPEEFIINAETAYISENFERVRFTYMPDSKQVSGRIKFADLMRQMSANTSDNGRLYLEMLSQMADTRNLSISGLKTFITSLKREVRYWDIS